MLSRSHIKAKLCVCFSVVMHGHSLRRIQTKFVKPTVYNVQDGHFAEGPRDASSSGALCAAARDAD